ncbi:hypothetical protein [Mycoplasmopsis cynos]|uniref:hypothetical protein n=1 Tax=Mycoplasmopsis cynos TaxID=171284 RepID=UPI0024C998A0|nr:hypothetical protein [Mycoplasmopsis cynos]WAM04980.1 hypothetical protein ONA01_02270 [Mycoplasmopsis cynos]
MSFKPQIIYLIIHRQFRDVYSYSPSGAFTLSTPKLKYNFSLTELIPREYTKYGYESYFSINDENKSLDNEIEEKLTINWFGTRFITLDKKGEKNKGFFTFWKCRRLIKNIFK